MESKQCFELGCELEVEYACPCTSPQTLSCELHFGKHYKLPNRDHKVEPIFVEPCEGTKEATLGFLKKEKAKHSKLKRNIAASFSQRLFDSEHDIKELIKNLDSYSAEIKSTLEEHNKIINSTNEEYSKAICLENNELANVKDTVSKIIDENKKSQIELEDWKKAIENEENFLNSKIARISKDLNRKLNGVVKPQNQHSEHINVILQELRNTTSEIWNRTNTFELEQDFRSTCSIYESDASIYNPPLKQAYQDYSNAYHQKTSLYTIRKNEAHRTSLFVYDTESGREEIKVLETPTPLCNRSCIAQLPNGKLFCFGSDTDSGNAFLIDGNHGVRQLPYGTPSCDSSAIYFNRNVYCFGGKNNRALDLSERFDLDVNQWIKLTPIPQADYCCSSIITKSNILISGVENRNLLRYSIKRNTFTTIPFQFASSKRKILINAERLYLIECDNGSIYESEVSNDTAWRQIGTSIIAYCFQVYCSYNKGGINIACCFYNYIAYYKFDLNTKSLIGLF